MPTDRRPGWWGGVVRTLVLPAVVALLTAGGTAFALQRRYWGPPGPALPEAVPFDGVAVALLAIGPLALVFRRANRVVALLVTAAAAVIYLGIGYPPGPSGGLAVAVALVSTVAAGRHHRALAVVAGAGLVLAGWYLLTGRDVPPSATGPVLAWLVALFAAGLLWRVRRERIEQARRAVEEERRRRAGEERLRIAQELHDVLGHHVSLINVQAGVALFLMDDDPEQARTALTEIKRASRDLLREMRSTLGVLRGVDEQAPRLPTPGLDRLDALLDEAGAAGLPVERRTVGEPRPLPTGVDLAAYRIVQESLTNTRRHAGAASAVVTLRYTPDGLELTVDDDGAGPAGDATEGTGLTGMRERARSTGGTLEAGPGPERGFRVHARLPTSVPGEPPDSPAGGGPGDGTAEPAPPPATARGDGRVDR
ncbi:sensor histidine kinase [Pseudonocardia parietis]|uniref:histidine kinase n=1 Tax=Pseudonocardia parietis TaxID=570936 RepID=A0ABS4VMU7_9PSEU|nr:sensor histidine kinase [Pseudonocardia parietis]MBP2365249.1 signal transduction histidine kinase [Pseudonocardia parietis]